MQPIFKNSPLANKLEVNSVFWKINKRQRNFKANEGENSDKLLFLDNSKRK